MTINDLSMPESVLRLRMIAGFDGLLRRVTGVTILEENSLHIPGEGFSPGDLLLTDLYFAQGSPESILDAVKLLSEGDAAGLAVKTTYFSDLNQDIKDYADQIQFPIFLFDSVPLSDVLFYLYDQLKSQKKADLDEIRLRNMFPAPIPDAEILRNVLEINPAFQSDYYCAYLTPMVPSAILAAQSGPLPVLEQQYFSLVRYQKGWLLLASFPEGTVIPEQKVHFRKMLAYYRLAQTSFFCGLSQLYHDLTMFDLCLTEAVCASRLAQREQKPLLHFKELGVYQFLLPQLHSRGVLQQIRNIRTVLDEYDKKYRSNLLETLRVYVQNEGRIAQTAQALFLHVNTVRYRLDKLKELLGPEDFFVQAYIFIKADEFLGM
jgi:hypothetical protein